MSEDIAMDKKLLWQWIMIIVIFLVSLVGFWFPYIQLYKKGKDGKVESIGHSALFAMLKCFAIGVLIGVSLMHLLVDALMYLDEFSNFPGYNWILLSLFG